MATAHWKRGIVVAAVLCVCGCSKLTYERWQTIHVGTATPECVEATLGEPWKKADGTWVYNEPDQSITAMVKFKDTRFGQVVGDANAAAPRRQPTPRAGRAPAYSDERYPRSCADNFALSLTAMLWPLWHRRPAVLHRRDACPKWDHRVTM